MKLKHTPAPWKAIRDPDAFHTLPTVLAGEYKEGIWLEYQMAVQVGGLAGVEESEANTRLIAAAPVLLHALLMVLDDATCLARKETFDAVKDAIYQATGETI